MARVSSLKGDLTLDLASNTLYLNQGSHFLAYKNFQDFSGPPKRFSRTLS